MKNIILLSTIGFIIGIGGAYFLWQSQFQGTNVTTGYGLDPLKCNLLEKACVYDFNGQKLEIDLSPRPLQIMKKTKITIKGLNYDFYDAKVRVHGVNMDMGTIIASLNKVDDNTYETSVALSACLVEDVMRYRIDLYDGNNSMNFHADFDLPNDMLDLK